MEVNFEAVFIKFNDELSKAGQLLELVCAGGYVLQRHGYRATMDVDAFFKSNEIIDGLIKKVGDEFGINKENELWLNNSIASLNPEPPVEYCEYVYKYTNLIIKEISILYLIGMKLYSQRLHDLKDVAEILKHDENEKPFELFSELANMNFNIDISLLLEVYEMAYGMKWLENFYVANSSELLNHL